MGLAHAIESLARSNFDKGVTTPNRRTSQGDRNIQASKIVVFLYRCCGESDRVQTAFRARETMCHKDTFSVLHAIHVIS